MINFENITFQFFCNPIYNKLAPYIKILIDDNIEFEGVVKQRFIFTISKKLLFGAHSVKIVKEKSQPNQILKIEKIIIDGIDIRDIIWTKSFNQPNYPEPWASKQLSAGKILEKIIIGETDLSHNGEWTLNFNSPFYQFVIDSVKGKNAIIT